jgi:hypothetical protein
MKNRAIIFINGIIALLLISLTAQSQEKEQMTIPLSDPSKAAKLTVGIVTGSIKVTGYSGKDIVIDAVVQEENQSKNRKERSDGMKRISVNRGFEITARERDNHVTVGVSNPNLDVNITVRVPTKCSLKLSTVNNGNIDVENVHGNHEISNINGHIKMKSVAGSVLANTINEDIVVNFTDITANTPMAFTTLNGKVDVTFPANLRSNVKLKSDRGEVLSDFDIDIERTAAKVTQATDKDKGLYKIKKDDWTYGKINGGGAEIMMKSMNGDVYIRKIK